MGDLKDILPINKWFDELSSKPLIIAGPCSAESEKQVIETALEIASNNSANIFRSGVWKPRTRPGNFEGVGLKGLKWLQKVKEETGLLVTTEVATVEHIKMCLDHNIDILWVGARTTSNPFSVQELANACKGIDIPIMIKNPINPDTELWIGAIERFHSAGIKKLAAIHRGFYPFEQTKLRNLPKWEIPIELKSRFNNLPIICDPSHISGSTEFISEISQKAIDLNFDGLMIETHNNPMLALSDAKQQITPKELDNLLTNLVIRHYLEENGKLEMYRHQIDSIDTQMLELLSQRMDIISEIGKYKKKENITIFQLRRWENIIKTRTKTGQSLNLNKDFIIELLQLVHKESISKQNKILNK